MKQNQTQLLVCILALAACAGDLPGQSLNSSFTSIFAFGDSLSDAGNVFAATSSAAPLPGAYTDGTATGRFTNGLNWVDLSSQRYGLGSSIPSELGGNNFAWGGAMTGAGLSALGTPNVGTQIQQFAAARGTFPAHSLITLWAGSNDYLSGGALDPAGVVNNLLGHLDQLRALGGSQFVVANLPDLAQTPTAKGSLNAAGLSALHLRVTTHNSLLATGVANFRLNNPGVAVLELDAFGMMNALIADPGAYGLTNVSSPVFTGSFNSPGLIIGDPAAYLFFDRLHPTATAHDLYAIPEPAHAGFALLIAAWLVAIRRRR
jgi:phospholipase/lecithinase/hemolysin